MMADSRQQSAVMAATLSAELEGKVPADLVADLVRAVLDESRRSAHDRGVEPSMAEARQRLERFVHAAHLCDKNNWAATALRWQAKRYGAVRIPQTPGGN